MNYYKNEVNYKKVLVNTNKWVYYNGVHLPCDKGEITMKIVRLGKEHTRYTLIVMKMDSPREDAKSIDDTITYYNSDDIEELLMLAHQLKDNIQLKVNHWFKIDIFDYHDGHYINY